MKRWEYVLLAEALRAVKPNLRVLAAVTTQEALADRVFEACARAIADALARENPNGFSTDMFMKNAGVITYGKTTPQG
jgi:hypothetical protein